MLERVCGVGATATRCPIRSEAGYASRRVKSRIGGDSGQFAGIQVISPVVIAGLVGGGSSGRLRLGRRARAWRSPPGYLGLDATREETTARQFAALPGASG